VKRTKEKEMPWGAGRDGGAVGKEASNEGSFHLSPLLAAPSLAALYICPSEGQMEESKALDLHTAWPAGVKG